MAQQLRTIHSAAASSDVLNGGSIHGEKMAVDPLVPRAGVAIHNTQVEQRSASPKTNARHFSENRFADAPISQQSKAGLNKFEYVNLDLLRSMNLTVLSSTGQIHDRRSRCAS